MEDKICKVEPKGNPGEAERGRERGRGSENDKNDGADLGNTGRRAGAGRAADTQAVMNHMSPAQGKNERQVPRRPAGGEAGRGGAARQVGERVGVA